MYTELIGATSFRSWKALCKFLLHVILEEYKIKMYNKICLFSDNAGGIRIRNWNSKLKLSIFTLFAATPTHNVIAILVCIDRKKMREIIETEHDYIDLIKNAKTPPFILVEKKDCIVKDYEKMIPKSSYEISKDVQISKFCRIKYYPNGQVDSFKNYIEAPETVFVKKSVTYDDLQSMTVPVCVGISQEKETFKPVKSEIETTYRKSSFMSKPR